MAKLHPFHIFPVHFFHKEKPPVIANDQEAADKAVADGYTTEYSNQDYPKYVALKDANGNPVLGLDGAPKQMLVAKPPVEVPVAPSPTSDPVA